MRSGPAVRSKAIGLSDLAAALKALPAELASKSGGPLKRALFKGPGKLIRDTAIEYAPVGDDPEEDPGRLKRAIKIKRDPHPGDVTERYVIRVRTNKKTGAPYWRFPEFGVHTSNRNQAAQAYMRRAAEDKWEEGVDRFKAILTAEIEKIRRKIYAKAKRRGR